MGRRSAVGVCAASIVLAGLMAFAHWRPALSPEARAADRIAPRTADEQALSDLELLGKRLFEDLSLSEPPGQSCASCHDPKHAFQGNNGSPIAAVALGSRPDQLGMRNTPTIMYSALSPPFSFVEETGEDGSVQYTPTGGQFWDGRAPTLAAQIKTPLLNAFEMNNPTLAAVVEKVRRGANAALAEQVLGPGWDADADRAIELLGGAVAAFERTPRFMPFSSKFDDFLRGKVALSAEEAEGFALFKDPEKGNCIACHVGDVASRRPQDWPFTDFTYDNIGAPRNEAIPANANPAYFDLGLCARPGIDKIAPKDFDIHSLCGAFKVPTLRNVEVTAPYFHNGAFEKLRDVVAFYVTRDTDPARWYPKDNGGVTRKFNDLPAADAAAVNTEEVPYDRKPGQQPRLNDHEIDALVSFLATLTDTR